MYTEGGMLIKQARDKGINVPFMGGDGMDSSTLVEIAGDAVKIHSLHPQQVLQRRRRPESSLLKSINKNSAKY